MDVYDEVDRRENDAGETRLIFDIFNVGISVDVLTFSMYGN